MLSEVLGVVVRVVSMRVTFVVTVELATVMFSKCAKQRILYYWQLRKNYKEVARCLSETNTNLYSWRLLGDTKNWVLLLTIQGAPASSCVTLNAKETFNMYTLKVPKTFTTMDKRDLEVILVPHIFRLALRLYVRASKIISVDMHP